MCPSSGKKELFWKNCVSPFRSTETIVKEYKHQLRLRPIHPNMRSTRKLRDQVIQMKLKVASQTKTKPFVMEDIEKVLKDIKQGKSRDPDGIARDTFKEPIIGNDLKISLLTLHCATILFNRE